jgi:hypothetical protein
MAPPKGKSNNERGVQRGDRNATQTRRERVALDRENSGSEAKRAAVIAERAKNAGHR